MGKSKTSGNKNRTLSAFAVYSAEANSTPKKSWLESASSLIDSKAVSYYIPGSNSNVTNHDQTTASKVSTATSSSLIKQMSTKAAFSLRRASTRRKKKLKKFLKDSETTHWNPSGNPNNDICKSPLVNFSNTRKPISFNGHARNGSSTGKKSNVQSVEKESEKIIYKADSSVELSTSRSLTSSENEDESLPKKKSEHVSMNLVVMAADEAPPPKKKVRIADKSSLPSKKGTKLEAIKKGGEDKRNGRIGKEDNDELLQLHGKESKNSEKKKVSTSFTTISKKVSTVPKMPLSEGDSERDGQSLFKWLIHPYNVKNFFSSIWEIKPMLVRRHFEKYAEDLFTSEDLNKILTESNVRFGVNLDVTTYQNGRRETHNIEGRAYAPVVWDYYKNDCSVRLKNPQAFSKPVWKLCSTLQEYFKSMVGANIYLTPPGTQGFAPHYDDIEAFVLQLEGKKHWSLYSPRSKNETLPRLSSRNFEPNEIGEEIFTTTLEPGDLLYFPRGFIHQAKSLSDCHSLHITISTYQKNTWGDLMEELVPATLAKALAEDVEFRKGLPLDCLSCVGVQNCDKVTSRRKEMLKHVSDLFRRLADLADVDAAVDQRAVEYVYSALPPVLTSEEEGRSVQGARVRMTSPGCPAACLFAVNLDAKVRILRKNAVRLCMNADSNENTDVRVYHSIQNSRVYHEEERKYFEMDADCAPALEYLIHGYPNYVTVNSLPLSNEVDKVNFASSLLEKGVLVTETKLKLVEEKL